MQGNFSVFLHHFVLAKLATSSIRVNFKVLGCIDTLEVEVEFGAIVCDFLFILYHLFCSHCRSKQRTEYLF